MWVTPALLFRDRYGPDRGSPPPGWVRLKSESGPQTGARDVQHDGQAREPALVVLGVSGELDVACAQQLRSELESVIDRAPGEVVIDLSALAFCDSSGLSALLNARLHALASGRVLCLAGASPQMLRLLELTGARGLFPVVPVPPT